MTTPPLPTYFHIDGGWTWEVSDQIPLVKGQGVLTSEGKYRVVDVWFSFDHHGPLDDGLHVFLESTDDEAP